MSARKAAIVVLIAFLGLMSGGEVARAHSHHSMIPAHSHTAATVQWPMPPPADPDTTAHNHRSPHDFDQKPYDFFGCWVNTTPEHTGLRSACTECHCFIEEMSDAKTPKYFIKGAFPKEAKERIREAVAAWSAVTSDDPALTTGILFKEAAKEADADFVIEWSDIDDGSCGGETTVNLLNLGIALDSSFNWSFEKDPGDIKNPTTEPHFLSVALHEFGHILFLYHTKDEGLMDPSVAEPSVCDMGKLQGQLCDSKEMVEACMKDGGTCVGACGSTNEPTRNFMTLDGMAIEAIRDGYSIPAEGLHMLSLLDRTGSMTIQRPATGNSRCNDALQLTKKDVESYFAVNSQLPGASVAVWTFAGSAPTDLTGGFVDEATALAALNSLTPEGCTGLTSLAEAICAASDTLTNAFPNASPDDRVLAISSDGGENNSSGECAGPGSASRPPYDAGSWQRKVSDKVAGQNVALTRFWGAVARGIDMETGLARLLQIDDSIFFENLAQDTGGEFQFVTGNSPLPPPFFGISISEPSTAEIPTLSTVGLITIVLLLVIAGGVLIRRH